MRDLRRETELLIVGAGVAGCTLAWLLRQACETVVVKDGTCCYTIMYHTREEHAQANRALYEEILSSVRCQR